MIETSMVWNGMVEPTVNHEYAEVQVHDMVPFHAAPAVPRIAAEVISPVISGNGNYR